jgi:hypothetical protein
MAQGDEVRQTGFRLLRQDTQGIDPASAGRGLDVGFQRNSFTLRTTRVMAIGGRGPRARRVALEDWP